MSAGMVVETIFSGPNPALIAVMIVLAVAAAGAVVWSLRLLIVDPRASDFASDELPGAPAMASTGDDGRDLNALDR
jgi:hypothetical protein